MRGKDRLDSGQSGIWMIRRDEKSSKFTYGWMNAPKELFACLPAGGNFRRGSGAISEIEESSWTRWGIRGCLGERRPRMGRSTCNRKGTTSCKKHGWRRILVSERESLSNSTIYHWENGVIRPGETKIICVTFRSCEHRQAATTLSLRFTTINMQILSSASVNAPRKFAVEENVFSTACR